MVDVVTINLILLTTMGTKIPTESTKIEIS